MTKPTRTPQPVARGAEVVVREPGLTPWTGTALAVKWSPVSGWWIEVAGPEGVWIIREADVEVAP